MAIQPCRLLHSVVNQAAKHSRRSRGRESQRGFAVDEPLKPSLFRPAVGNHGMTELHFAAYCGDLAELRRCLAAGADVHATDTYRGYTAVHWLADMAAAGGPRVMMLQALARHGADLNARTPDGTTPLMLAREAGSAGGDRLVAELLALGAHDAAPGAPAEI
jgi:hypothetical protein